MVQFLNYGITEEILSFFGIGGILLSAYGFSAFLVPIFLFVSSITLFSAGFNKKKAVILASSILPFFTVVATERICKSILPGSTEPVFILKLVTAICICALLIAIEYLSIGIAYDSFISIKRFGKKKKQNTNESVSESENSENKETEIAIIDEVPEDSEITRIDFTKEENSPSDDEIFEEENESLENEEISNQEQEVEISEEQEDVEVEREDDNEQESLIEEEQAFEVKAEEPIQVSFSKSEKNQDEVENEIEENSEENYESQEENSGFQDLYEPDSGEADFLENPFGDDEIEPDVEEVEPENEVEKEFENQVDVYKYDYDIEPEITTEYMSEEERMNATVPLMNIQLGDEDDEIDEEENNEEEVEIESSNSDFQQNDIKEPENDSFVETEKVIEKKSSSFDDFDQIDFDDIEENNDVNQEIENQDNDDFDVEDENSENENDDFEVQSEEVEIEIEEKSQVIPSVPKKKKGTYRVPSEGLLTSYPDGEYWIIDSDTQKAAVLLKDTLSEFKIEAEVTGIRKGPVITMFEILPAPGVKLSKIVALQDNIALRLAASSIRIVAPIPGKSAVGIEVPNKERAIVSFKELIETETAAYKKMAIPVVLGKDITGEAQLLDLAKTPHLLIAGSTGSGKSVCVNSMILSILYKRSPNEVKLILIDPKVVELKLYNDIPHLLTPVITEPKRAFQAMQYCLCEMERRYALLDGMGVRDITSYNRRIEERNIATEKLPYIVVVIDEFADLMATTGKELESVVARLAAMSRAVGIHLVLATQRPSIDVITGLIKANIPTRIAFMVASKMDSRIIIDQVGAEKLLGRGDMLYASATDPFPVRIQGTFVSDNEVENVVDFVKQYGEPEYIDDEIFVEDDDEVDVGPNLFGEGEDPLYNKALEIVIQAGKASASYIQRRLKIGYNRAARLVEDMEARGIVGPANGSKPREIIHIP